MASPYGAVAQASLGAQEAPAATPHSASPSSANAYTSAMVATTLSPRNVPNNIAMAYSQAGPSMIQPSMGHAYNTTPQSAFSYTPQLTPQMTQSPATVQMMPQPQRPAWDFPYLEHAPAASNPSSTAAHGLYYQREDASAAASQDSPAAQYQMIPSSSGP